MVKISPLSTNNVNCLKRVHVDGVRYVGVSYLAYNLKSPYTAIKFTPYGTNHPEIGAKVHT